MDGAELLRLFGERLGRGDASGAVALFTPDAHYQEPPAPAVEGRDALYMHLADAAMRHSDVHFTVLRTISAPGGSPLAAEWRWSYTRTSDGKQKVFEGICVIEIQNGAIAHWRSFSSQVG